MDIFVRLEEQKDYRTVEEITRLAFSNPGRIQRGGIGCPFEHWMVHELRLRDGIRELSLVAEAGHQLAGHIIGSNAVVKTREKVIPVLNFGPLSVLPEYQRKGVGKALVKALIGRAKDLGYGAILFFGRPEYYPQFGFQEASVFGVTDSQGQNCSAFMGMELVPGYLSQAAGGRFSESDIYDDALNREQAKAYDRNFN
ncbi:MAG TPA: N-acetyltransferase [Candidatus Merdivicinus intestinigallinarum]|nr:N-acetyltransferase [Candidatus Merdivicinus intestinigallinarum]